MFLGQIFLRERLLPKMSALLHLGGHGEIYRFVRRITDLLAHEIIHPLIGLVVRAFGLEAGDYERHVD
jgi:hypothetical protein